MLRGRLSTALGLPNPPMQRSRVDPTRQGHRRDRDARLLAGTYRFGLEMRAVASTTTTTVDLDQLSSSIHVNAYLL
jgi:hypothetical protein